jgi:hypothetical protein
LTGLHQGLFLILFHIQQQFPHLLFEQLLLVLLQNLKKLCEDSNLDHALATFVSLVLTVSSNNNLLLVVKLDCLLIFDRVFPPE